MANNILLVDERQSDIGNFIVGRLLPFRKKRQVGPFTFIDHMGPLMLGAGNYADVDQHPHIGLSTLTYLLEGEIEHRDSLGSRQVIAPGDVGFMTSGSGVSHTERTPEKNRDGTNHVLHGYQIWVALPKELEEMSPRFDFFPKHILPTWQENSLRFTLVAGSAFGKHAPLQGYSPLFMVDISAKERATIDLQENLKGEVAVVIVKGSITDGEHCVKAGQMMISKSDEACTICLEENTQVLLFGGEPLVEEPLLLWNFVSHSKARLSQAKEDWIAKKFPLMGGEESYIPFPSKLK